MTCHCGNCEDHRVDSWKMFDNKEEQAPVQCLHLWQFVNASKTFARWACSMCNLHEDRPCVEVESGTPDSWKGETFVKVPPTSTEKLVEEAKEYAKAVTASRRQLLTIVLTTNEKNDRFVVRIDKEGAKTIYEQETGIEPQYLAHVAEDYLIPLRNLLENLGFEVQEIYI